MSFVWMLNVFFFFWRIIHYRFVGKTFGDIDAVKRRCMDHVFVNSNYVTICGEWSELFTWKKLFYERGIQVTGLLFHMRITVNGKEQRFKWGQNNFIQGNWCQTCQFLNFVMWPQCYQLHVDASFGWYGLISQYLVH